MSGIIIILIGEVGKVDRVYKVNRVYKVMRLQNDEVAE